MSDSSAATVETLSQAIVVHALATNLGKTEVDALCGEIDRAQSAAAPTLPFILDLSHVSFMGSLAMGVLVGLHQEFRNRGQRLIFANLQPNVHQSFNVSRISGIMEIVTDVPAALK